MIIGPSWHQWQWEEDKYSAPVEMYFFSRFFLFVEASTNQ